MIYRTNPKRLAEDYLEGSNKVRYVKEGGAEGSMFDNLLSYRQSIGISR